MCPAHRQSPGLGPSVKYCTRARDKRCRSTPLIDRARHYSSIMRLLYIFWIFAVAHAAIVGIDYGHQFTKAIMVAPGIPFEIVFTDEGKRKDLSALSLKPILDGKEVIGAERLYGSQIGSLCIRFPEACAPNLKRLLGKSSNDEMVSEYLLTHFGVTLSKQGSRDAISLRLGSGKNAVEFPVEEVAAMSLSHLKDRVLKTLETNAKAQPKAEDVAVAVGAYASQLTRHAYLDTLDLAGYSSVLGLVDEGTAVAIAFAQNNKLTEEQYDGKTSHYMVYDVGAGSTSATLFSYTPFDNHTVEVNIESVGYDETFGGELFTTEIYKLMFEKVCKQFNFDPSESLRPRLAARLRETAEKAKIILSANSEYFTTLESFYDDADFQFKITREEYETALSGLFERSMQPILDSLANSPDKRVSLSDLRAVILNGGSSRTPFIQKQLVSLLGSEEKIAKVVNTDEACAFGTAVQAYNWKTILTNTPVIVNDRIHKTFQASIGSSALINVFERGTSSKNESVVSLGPLVDKAEIAMFEDGTAFSHYNISGLLQKSKLLKCKEEERVLFGTFTVDRSKLFKLSNLAIKCPEEDDEIAADSKNSTEFNSTVLKKLTSINVPLPAKKFTNLRPLSGSEKRKITAQLNDLKLHDLQKIKFEEAKNVLESACYSLRNTIEDYRDALSFDVKEDVLEQLLELANEVVEWLEYDADDFGIDTIQEKYEVIIGHKQKIEKVMRLQNVDLSQARVKSTFKQAEILVSNVQEIILRLGEQENLVKKKYDADSIDFNNENEKAIRYTYGKQDPVGMKVPKMLLSMDLSLKNISSLVEMLEKEFLNVDKTTLYDLVESIETFVEEMRDEIDTLESNHEKKLKYLSSQYERIKLRKAQRELNKKNPKGEKESVERHDKVEDENELNDDSGENVDPKEVGSEKNSSSTEPAVEDAEESKDFSKHDEL